MTVGCRWKAGVCDRPCHKHDVRASVLLQAEANCHCVRFLVEESSGIHKPFRAHLESVQMQTTEALSPCISEVSPRCFLCTRTTQSGVNSCGYFPRI